MPKPPKETPHSDLDGVNRDRRPIDAPENADPRQARRLKQEHEESKGRPAPSRP